MNENSSHFSLLQLGTLVFASTFMLHTYPFLQFIYCLPHSILHNKNQTFVLPVSPRLLFFYIWAGHKRIKFTLIVYLAPQSTQCHCWCCIMESLLKGLLSSYGDYNGNRCDSLSHYHWKTIDSVFYSTNKNLLYTIYFIYAEVSKFRNEYKLDIHLMEI